MQAIDSTNDRQTPVKGWTALGGWALVLFLFATQWYAYDRTRGDASPYAYYIGWSLFMWALAPFVLWFARRNPIQMQTWQQSLALHVVVSIALSIMQVLVETGFGWLRAHHGLSFEAALSHYFVQHLQLYLLTYWGLVAAAQFYRLYDESRNRQLRAARLETQLSAAKLESLRSQLQPHFLFNTLHAAVGLIHEDPDGTEDILLRLSELLRASLAELHTNEITLRKEMELVDCYIGIQKRRFGERLSFENTIDPGVLDHAVPSLILQPLVENAIRHGIGIHKGSDVISLKAFQAGIDLWLEVCNLSSSLSAPPEELLSRGVGCRIPTRDCGKLYGGRQTLELLSSNRARLREAKVPAQKCGSSQ